MKSDAIQVRRIRTAIAKARVFVEGMDRAQFLADEKTQSAVIMQLAVIGELAKRVSDAFRASKGEVPWREIAGFRDRAIHNYFQLDLDIVWHAVMEDLVTLDRQLEE